MISDPRTSKPTIIPSGPKKILVSEQWILGLRRFARKTIDHVEACLKELEEKHPPVIRHAKGCRAAKDDNLICLPACPDRELRATLKCIKARLHDIVDQAPIRKFGADEEYSIPSRDAYTALVVECEYLRDRLAELDPAGAPRIGAPEIMQVPETVNVPEKAAT